MRRCTGRRNLTGRILVSGFVDAPGRRDDIVAYADTYKILAALRHSKNTERIYESSVCICLALARTFNLTAIVRAEAGESAETHR